MAARIKGKTSTAPDTTTQARNTEQLVQRVKRELLWILISSAVAMGLGLLAGNFFKL